MAFWEMQILTYLIGLSCLLAMRISPKIWKILLSKSMLWNFHCVKRMVLPIDNFQKQKHLCPVLVETRCVGKY